MQYKHPLLKAIVALDLHWMSLRFKSAELQRLYDQQLIEKGVFFGIKVQVGCFAAIFTTVIYIIIKSEIWLQQRTRPDNDNPNWIQIGIQSLSLLPLVFLLTCSLCGWWRRESWYPKLFYLMHSIFITLQCILPELYMALAWPRYQLDMPTTVIMCLNLQFLFCGFEGDFLDKFVFGWSLVAFRIISFSFLIATPNLLDLIPELINATSISLAAELPQLLVSAFACTVMGYWQTIFQKSKFLISNASAENVEKTVEIWSNLSGGNISMTKDRDFIRKKPKQLESKIVSPQMRNWKNLVAFKEELNLRNEDGEYQIFAFKTLVSMFKQFSITLVGSFTLNLLPLKSMQDTTKLALVSVFGVCVACLTYFALYWSARIERVVPWVIQFLNWGTVFLSFITFLPSLSIPIGDDDSFRIFASVCQSACVLGMNLTILAGLQWRILFIYVQVLSAALVVKCAILIPVATFVLYPLSFSLLFLSCSQISLIIGLVTEQQLHEFFVSSEKIASNNQNQQ